MNVQEDLIKLMKNLYFRHKDHQDLFKGIVKFLYRFSYRNKINQTSLLPHLNYLLSLNHSEINTPKLISLVLTQARNSSYGYNFLHYLLDRIVTNSLYNAQLFNLLSIMAAADNDDRNKVLYLIRHNVDANPKTAC